MLLLQQSFAFDQLISQLTNWGAYFAGKRQKLEDQVKARFVS
ncbi:hypothetical protein [Spirosoma sp.]|nr:hypothetical protein [Spirosoma sp.]MCX6215161.1 hypothetical protein [Spirosoma sp.]